ncbi:MAG: hypothetical protein NT062_27200 [Proteobacteria bacterium]|nr:hypothetical protein [Pseudomonadota bacterium]
MDSGRLQRWQRIAQISVDAPEVQALRAAILEVAQAPDDRERRQRMRGLAESVRLELTLPAFLIAETHAQQATRVVVGLRDEIALAYASIGEAQTADDDPADRDRAAFARYLVGDWAQTAELLVGLAMETSVEDALVYLRAAGRLFHNIGNLPRAMEAYRAIAMRRPSDFDALSMLATLINTPVVSPFILPPPPTSPARPPMILPSPPPEPAPAPTPPPAPALPPLSPPPAPAAPVSAPLEAADDLGGATVIGVGVGGDHTPLPPRVPAVLPTPPITQTRRSRTTSMIIHTIGEAPATPLLATVEDSELDERLEAAFGGGFEAPGDAPPSLDTAIPAPIAPEPSLPTGAPIVTNVLAAAKAAAEAGDLAGAEQRLRAFIALQPSVLASHLALVDLLRTNDRAHDALAHLGSVLERSDLRPKQRAALLHRRALIAIAQGAGDHAMHEALREAHTLDPGSLSIALTFGSNCYARKEWEDTARVLGAVAAHPQASGRIAAVTRGLLHAAIAELRLHLPDRAAIHCEAALALDPAYDPVVRLLAMLRKDRSTPTVDDDDEKTTLSRPELSADSVTISTPKPIA